MEIAFPDEQRVTAELSEGLAGHFDYAQRLLRFWMEEDKDTGLERSTLPPIVLRVLGAMSVKACRQFRTVIELCRRGEAADASTIARSMFETALVVGFVLKPRFVPRRFDSKGNVTGTLKVPGPRLTKEFRASLYVAHHVLQPERFATRHSGRPGMIRIAKRVARRVASDGDASSCKREIGAEWTKILVRWPPTYSGLSISDLARSLGKPFPMWYDVVYGVQSEHVHAADLLHHIQTDEHATTPQWHEPGKVHLALGAAIDLFGLVVGWLNQSIGFGVVMSTALHAFKDEYGRMPKLK